jgi:two-component system sensor histidine kinase TctE
VEGLPLLLRELMNNLIDNALQHTPRGGTVTVRLSRGQPARSAATMPSDPPPAGFLFEVEDTGTGISPADQARIFDRFYQVLGGRSEGSGLGLAIVLEIADQHQAGVFVQSPVVESPSGAGGGGSRFQVFFPDPPQAPAT